MALSFPLSSTRGLFRIGVISSTEVVGEAVLKGLVMEARGVTEMPFSTTHTILFPMLKRGLFFLPIIFTYIPRLNLVVIPTIKLLSKKRERKGVVVKNLTLTLFFLNFNSS